MLKEFLYHLSVIALAMLSTGAMAASYELANGEDSLIGRPLTTHSEYKDTLLDIARKHGFGYREIILSNPGVDVLLPGAGKEIALPSQFLLPHAPRQGIVLNIPELRLYYYPPRKQGAPLQVYTFPVGIGKEGWNTPYARTNIIKKQKDPSWYPPESIRREHAARGDILPKRVAPGPDNPLGKYAMRMGLGAYLIHGTNNPDAIGMRASHGCIRLYPEDIENLYSMVGLRTPVNIINQPFKVALHQGKIYLEAHPSLEEDENIYRDNLTSVVQILIDVTAGSDYTVDWDLAKRVIRELQGIPVAIGIINGPATTVAETAGPSGRKGLKLRLDTKLTGSD
ncbi:MAG: YkuD protein [Gammaproteobacteria bacterium]|nr:YkuD protein [Gammaproteobacteria bacterium]